MSSDSRRSPRYPMPHQDSSISMSSASTLTSGGSNHLPTTPVDEPWRPQFTETFIKSYSETIRPMHPPLASHFAVALPPLISPERLPDIPPDSNQRYLPPPRSSSPQNHTHPLRTLSQTTPQPAAREMPRHNVIGLEQRAPALDRSESEVVNTLAVLAHGNGLSDFQRRSVRSNRPSDQ